jgi:hypothetical protein
MIDYVEKKEINKNMPTYTNPYDIPLELEIEKNDYISINFYYIENNEKIKILYHSCYHKIMNEDNFEISVRYGEKSGRIRGITYNKNIFLTQIEYKINNINEINKENAIKINVIFVMDNDTIKLDKEKNIESINILEIYDVKKIKIERENLEYYWISIIKNNNKKIILQVGKKTSNHIECNILENDLIKIEDENKKWYEE